MTLTIDGRTGQPEVGKAYRQFLIDLKECREPLVCDEGTIRVTEVRSDSYTFDVLESPSWYRPMGNGRGCSSRVSNFDDGTQLGWYRMWVPIAVPANALYGWFGK